VVVVDDGVVVVDDEELELLLDDEELELLLVGGEGTVNVGGVGGGTNQGVGMWGPPLPGACDPATKAFDSVVPAEDFRYGGTIGAEAPALLVPPATGRTSAHGSKAPGPVAPGFDEVGSARGRPSGAEPDAATGNGAAPLVAISTTSVTRKPSAVATTTAFPISTTRGPAPAAAPGSPAVTSGGGFSRGDFLPSASTTALRRRELCLGKYTLMLPRPITFSREGGAHLV